MRSICMVVDSSYPDDIRVRKEAESLAENGAKVMVVCPLNAKGPQYEEINKVSIYRIGKKYTHFKKGLNDIFESIFDLNPFFYFGLKKVFKTYEIDVLHVHDLPLAGTGYRFRSKVNKALILDLHENYPEAIKTWFKWKKNPLIRLKNLIFMRPSHWSKKEEKYCRKYDRIICVVDEMKEKLIAKFNLDPSKLMVISNHEKMEFVHNFENGSQQKVIENDVYSICYVGGFGPHRGLDTAILAMPEIVKNIPKAKLYLVGRGSADVEAYLKNLVKETGITRYVEFVGYRPFNEVAAIMQNSNLNIIPHKSNDHTNNTIPHKLFQIMLSKSLLMVSSCRPLKRIVEAHDAGLVFEADDSNDFAIKVVYAYQNHSVLKYKTENAFDAVMNKGQNWEAESIKLITLYSNLVV